MTQKELLYVEDAIGHEDEMINILEYSITKTNDKELISYLEDEVKNHENLKTKLIKKLGSVSNEW